MTRFGVGPHRDFPVGEGEAAMKDSGSTLTLSPSCESLAGHTGRIGPRTRLSKG
jgi:hypothetical protein